MEFIIILGACAVISAKNPVHSILFLILVFLNTAMLLISIGIDFLGIFIIIVYVGAIAILFLFVVMMLNIKLTELNEGRHFSAYLPIGFLFGLLFLFLFSFFILETPVAYTGVFKSEHNFNWLNELSIKGNNLVQLGLILYTTYLPQLMIAAIILLVAMLGVIVLTFTQITSKQNRYQEVYQQNSSFLDNHLFT
jgi:NADH-quinone oxidoreductase subunit J